MGVTVLELLDPNSDTATDVMASQPMDPDRQMHSPTFTSRTRRPSHWSTTRRPLPDAVAWGDSAAAEVQLVELAHEEEPLHVRLHVEGVRPGGLMHGRRFEKGGKIGIRWVLDSSPVYNTI